MQHAFFRSIDFQALVSQALPPPFIPAVDSEVGRPGSQGEVDLSSPISRLARPSLVVSAQHMFYGRP
eukprot:scaffold17746_cov112-Isochrysis_galbana.AAC.5